MKFILCKMSSEPLDSKITKYTANLYLNNILVEKISMFDELILINEVKRLTKEQGFDVVFKNS